jgi:putative endonuclease
MYIPTTKTQSEKTKQLGRDGEAFVAQRLEQQGFKILARNYTTRLGEVDIIAGKEDLIVFVEVKTRLKAYFPVSTVVTRSKQQSIIKATKHFVLANQIRDKVLRFDVATVIYDQNKPQLQYIENAFWAA